MTKPTYATREQFKLASDVRTTANLDVTVDRLLNAASRSIDQAFHRHFYPETATYTYEFSGAIPGLVGGKGFYLERDLYSLTSATVDDTAQTVADIELYPERFAPPYSWIGLMGAEVEITGVWGYSQDSAPAGALEEAISDTTGASVDVTDSALIGVGDAIKIDSEWMVVTEKSQLDTGRNNNSGAVTADASDVTISVSGSTPIPINENEIILMDSEKMLVTDVTGNDITVVRAYDGTTLASHSNGADIYAPRTLTVVRGALGSTAATHTDTTSITRNLPPYEITALCIAETQVLFQNERAAQAPTAGAGDNQRDTPGSGLSAARDRAAPLMRRRLAAI